MELVKLVVCLLTIVAGANSVRNGKYEKHGNIDATTSMEAIRKELLTSPVPTNLTFTTPYDPLTSAEMRLAALIVRVTNSSHQWRFEFIGLQDPDKSVMLPYYLSGTYPPQGSIPRKAYVVVIDSTTRVPSEIVVNLDTLQVESWVVQIGKTAPAISIFDAPNVCNITFTDPGVLQRLTALGYTDISALYCDKWGAGYVADNPKYASAQKLIEVYIYAMDFKGDNRFAHPFDFVVFLDLVQQAVLGIEDLPIQYGFDRTDRTGNSVPTATANYFPDLLGPNGIRDNVKPIKISQPNGPSYTIRGREVSWQFFKFIIGYNPREGPHIHTVTYNDHGQIRPVVYRLSLSDIWLRYGDPRPPYQTESSQEEANFELGSSIVELAMHTFCRGDPFFYDTEHHDVNGNTWIVPTSICVNEEDNGVLWANFDNTRNQTAVTRNQRLTVSFLVDVGHMNYWISWRFYQDATVELAVKNTGRLFTHLMAIDVKAPPYGSLLANQVYSQNYQHYFAVRADLDVDGPSNYCSMVDIVPVQGDAGSATNPYGNGITTQSTVFNTAGDSPTDLNFGTYRTWRVSNPSQTQPLNGNPTSYDIIPQGPNMPCLLTPNSPLQTVSPWTAHNMWVLPYDPTQIFAQGYFMDSGVADWTAANPGASINNVDIVLWYVFQYVRIVKLEDYPVLFNSPGDIGFRLEPSNFFGSNPALSVPPASVTTALDGTDGWGSGGVGNGWNSGNVTGWNGGTAPGWNGGTGAGWNGETYTPQQLIG